MNLIKQFVENPIIKEDAAGGAVGGGAVAVAAFPLFSSMVKRPLSTTPRVIKYGKTKKKGKHHLNVREAFYSLAEELKLPGSDQAFDSSEVISKLKGLEDKESIDYRDTSTFGLVDEKGEIVRVTVPTDQSESFEQEIQRFLTDHDESKEKPEIAEVLFKLKDRYTIVEIEWPTVEEDQEESQELAGKEGEQAGMEGGLPGDEATGGAPAPGGDELAGMGGDTGEDTGQVQSLLTQIIDMMKADADARKAEAQAREAEAKTKQADSARDQAMARVKQEEQLLDMDEYTKSQKEKEKEAKRLAQLAKWKHDMRDGKVQHLPAQDPQYDFLPGEEEEETFARPQRLQPQNPIKGSTVRGRVSPGDVAKFIMSRVGR